MRFLYFIAIATSMIVSGSNADLLIPDEWKDRKPFSGPVVNEILNQGGQDRAHQVIDKIKEIQNALGSN